jgi:hypothetical protein
MFFSAFGKPDIDSATDRSATGLSTGPAGRARGTEIEPLALTPRYGLNRP